jgi:hypothetical protein
LPETARFVAGVIRDQYPDLKVPFHARWRHFVFGGDDLWADISAKAGFADADEQARAAFDLAIVSVLLDAGSGPGWRYRDQATGLEAARSEGLALASLRMFQAGAFSNAADQPLRADAGQLATLSPTELAEGFQVSDRQSAGRAGRPRRPAAPAGRSGCGAARICSPSGTRPVRAACSTPWARAVDGRLPAPVILEVLLEALGPVWQDRLNLGGVDLGDYLAASGDETRRRHRRPRPDPQAQPVAQLFPGRAAETAGIEVTDLDGLTGLAEYRNGGLFMDLGVVALKDPADADKALAGVGSAGRRLALDDRGPAGPDRPAGARRTGRQRRGHASGQRAGRRHLGRRPGASPPTEREGGGPPLTILSGRDRILMTTPSRRHRRRPPAGRSTS